MEINVSAQIVFVMSLLVTIAIAVVGKRQGYKNKDDDLANRSLNKWFIGLSAGATANSGFVVTGAVGLGYSLGIQWLMLPIAWFLGDLVFWKFFPKKMNEFGRTTNTVTLSQLITHGLSKKWATYLSISVSLVILAGLLGYTSAQWLAGQKFLSGAFGLSGNTALLIFALFIITYSSIGGFRGSVYIDSFQACVRLLSTSLILVSSLYIAFSDIDLFKSNLNQVNSNFFSPFPDMTIYGIVGFILGWAFASLGFGLGQPQIMSRYLAGKNPEETQSAKWIYIFFVQYTWIAMTVFGMILRGIMPNLEDPESGLSTFVNEYMYATVAGIIIADIFAVIASTANSLLISMAHSVRQDVLSKFSSIYFKKTHLNVLVLVLGLFSMAISSFMNQSVASLALSSVSMVGAGIAAPVMIKLFNWKHSGASISFAVISGVVTAVLWVHLGYSSFINEAAIGILISSLVNWTSYTLINKINFSKYAALLNRN